MRITLPSLIIGLLHLALVSAGNMPNPITDVPFKIIWNSATQICRKYLLRDLELKEYGIVFNDDQAWRGELLNLFYTGDKFGFWPKILSDNTVVNGGVPQNVDLIAQQAKLKVDVAQMMPNKDFQGVAIIDYEENLPLWKDIQSDGYQKRYVDASIALAKLLKPSEKNEKAINILAQSGYETGFKNMVDGIFRAVSSVRPKALWGLWGYPRCARRFDEYFCDIANQNKNEQSQWIYDMSQALYPNIYLNKKAILDTNNRATYILKIMNEAMRMSNRRANGPLPVYPYVRYQYEDDPFPSFLSNIDIGNTIGQAIDTGMSGIIIWGYNGDVGNCTLLSNYMKTTLGPIAKAMLNYANGCSKSVCSGNGRCIKSIFRSQALDPVSVKDHKIEKYGKFWANLTSYPTKYDGYDCSCFYGWKGVTCQTKST